MPGYSHIHSAKNKRGNPKINGLRNQEIEDLHVDQLGESISTHVLKMLRQSKKK
jgi:hypothetical protein